MIENIIFLLPPIIASITFSIVLSYFGNHILTRGIVFIDIAVAQIAALGTMIGILLGFAEESLNTQLISYIFTIVILGIFSLMRVKNQVLPQEAIIGIFYCIALGMALLLADMIPGGSNFITKTITGNVLWVTWSSIINCLFLFIPVMLIHVVVGKKVKAITSGETGKSITIGQARIYDLIFYITFGVIIVKAVPIMGIFLVFMLLIGPAAIVGVFSMSWKKSLIWSAIIGSLGSVIGIYLSYSLNVSNGPAIVSLIGISVYIAAFIRLFKDRSAERKVILKND